MRWLKSNWRWLMLSLLAVAILIDLLNRGSTHLNAAATTPDPLLETGKWVIRFLLMSLAMTPLRRLFGWNGAIKFRKPAGLWAFGFAGAHGLYYIRDVQLARLPFSMRFFIVLGLVGLIILTALAITSNRWAMRRLGKNWKRLHRLVYLAGGIVIYHAMLASQASKRTVLGDPQAIEELKIYLAVFVILLIVRIPPVRRALKQLPILFQTQRKVADDTAH